jgi:hypothetical protein
MKTYEQDLVDRLHDIGEAIDNPNVDDSVHDIGEGSELDDLFRERNEVLYEIDAYQHFGLLPSPLPTRADAEIAKCEDE